MSKELVVSSTPHETRVAIVEDDRLSEIYVERATEHAIAGGIYKGRVNRVLPGMQSAFVKIGLERDAFLYVTDIVDETEQLESGERDDVDEILLDPTDHDVLPIVARRFGQEDEISVPRLALGAP